MRSSLARRAVAFFLPLAVLATMCCGLVYASDQQNLRSGANDPQIQMAKDASTALDAGTQPSSLVSSHRIDVAHSLAPFLVIFDSSGNVLATDGQLEGHDPIPPAGVLTSAANNPPDIVTWQPGSDVRIATVVVRWHGGTVLAGRSLEQVEIRENDASLIVIAAWLVTLVAVGLASLVAAWLWPTSPGLTEPAS
jgi:hypothetical protein